MEAMRSSWTDERLDDGFQHMNRQFEDVNGRLDRIESRIDTYHGATERRFDGIQQNLDTIQRTIVYAILGVSAATITALTSVLAIFS